MPGLRDDLNGEGRLIRSRFVEAVMRSHARLTYETAAAIVADRNPQVRAEYATLVPHLDRLYELYQLLRTSREKRGAMDFDTQETVIEYGADLRSSGFCPPSAMTRIV